MARARYSIGLILLVVCGGGVAYRSPADPAEPDSPVYAQKIIDPLPKEPPLPPAVNVVAYNDIDRFVAAKWRAYKVRPAKAASEFDLVRRFYLDLAGLIPTFEQIDAYVSAPRRNRNRKLIDRLLASPRYADHWTIFWGDLLREQSQIRGTEKGVFRDYLRSVLGDNVPYNRWVADLITATGTTRDNLAVAFILRNRADPDELTIAATQVFLGTQLKCAQCHDHPFEPWKRSDFLGMRGFWEGTRRRFAFTEKVVRRGEETAVRFEKIAPQQEGTGVFLTGKTSDMGRGREGLAELLTAPGNPYFSRVAVNRLWAKLMGRGLVEPVDGFRADNRPSHPELLDWLAREFIDTGYDMKHIIRLICSSRTYQLAAVGGFIGDRSAEGPLFERMPLRRMTAEQLHDSILVSCGLVGSSQRGIYRPAIEKAYPRPGASFLGAFGSHDRQTIHPRDPEATIPQALELLNGDFLNNAVRLHPTHPVLGWLARGNGPALVVRKLFVQTLGREPTRYELDQAMGYLGESRGGKGAWSDLHWALINTREFMFIR